MGKVEALSKSARKADRLSGLSWIGSCPSPPPAAGFARKEAAFHSVNPANGLSSEQVYYAADLDDVENACWRAWEAFHPYKKLPNEARARFLESIAENIIKLGDELISLASEETGFGPVRVVSERDRTTNTLKMFAALVRDGSWVRASVDLAQANRRPLPKPDVRRMLRPLGPVAVFGASNFPLAYSVGGGDTASALAAGCPVVVKGHPAHPGTGEMVARAIIDAVEEHKLDPGTFAFLQCGGTREQKIGRQLVQHRCIRAVGFTGSSAGGKAIIKLATDRPDPIPVFAEMGSTNPVFILPGALAAQGSAIAKRLVASMCHSAGQMCTSPGLIFVPRGSDGETLIRSIVDALNVAEPQTMLSSRVRVMLIDRLNSLAKISGLEIRGGSPQGGHGLSETIGQQSMPVQCSAAIYKTTLDVFRATPTLHEEIFGPIAIAVVCDQPENLLDAAASIQGSLTGSIWASNSDAPLAEEIESVLEQRVGRLIFNGVPTGVEVCNSMVHGGPFPATNQSQSTAAGPLAIERWCRPVAYQNSPEHFLPQALLDANPLGIRRQVDGQWVAGPIDQ